MKASIVIPCRNEAAHIESCLKNIYSLTPPDNGFEVIVVDGMSTDGTREVLKKLQGNYCELVVLDNPKRTVPHAMNMGIAQAKGEYIIRADVRCIHPKSYLQDLIELSERTKADNVGGVLVPGGTTYVQKSIALAYKSPIAMGGALRDRGDFEGETDAVYGGCFRKKKLIDIGLYDEAMTRNQDDELSFRLRKSGGRVVQSGRIKVHYFPRKKYSQLFKQFLQYGYWKVAVLEKHPAQASWRHYAPALLVAGFAGLSVAAIFSGVASTFLFLYVSGYLSAITIEALRVSVQGGLELFPGVLSSICCIHFGFGTGFVSGLVSRLLRLKPALFESLSR